MINVCLVAMTLCLYKSRNLIFDMPCYRFLVAIATNSFCLTVLNKTLTCIILLTSVYNHLQGTFNFV